MKKRWWIPIAINIVAIIGSAIAGAVIITGYSLGILDIVYLFVYSQVWAIKGLHNNTRLPEIIVILCSVIGLIMAVFAVATVGMGPFETGGLIVLSVGGALILVAILTFITFRVLRARRK
ncbi:hypothetical protein ACFLVP_02205 [Chloroflexota bacterium]